MCLLLSDALIAIHVFASVIYSSMFSAMVNEVRIKYMPFGGVGANLNLALIK